MSPTCKDIFRPSHSSNPLCRLSPQFLSLPPSSCPPGEYAPACLETALLLSIQTWARREGGADQGPWSREGQNVGGWRVTMDMQFGSNYRLPSFFPFHICHPCRCRWKPGVRCCLLCYMPSCGAFQTQMVPFLKYYMVWEVF